MADSGGGAIPLEWDESEADDATWHVVLDENFIRNALVKELGACAGILAAVRAEELSCATPRRGGQGGPSSAVDTVASRPKRVWQRNPLITLFAGVLAMVVMKSVAPPAVSAVSAAQTRPSSVVSAPASASVSAPAATSPATTSAAAKNPASSERPMISLAAAFPRMVKGLTSSVYTLVGADTLKSCTEAGAVAPELAGMIVQSQGCVGLEYALYEDADGDRFDLSLFTMKAAADAASLIGTLAADPDDFEVSAQIPQAGSAASSGATALAAVGGGMVQQFASSGRAMIVGLGQGAVDGAGDDQGLENRLAPLFQAVAGYVTAYEAQESGTAGQK